jgi:hypothetical protein
MTMLSPKCQTTKNSEHICDSPLLVQNVKSLFHLVFSILRSTLERLARSPNPANFLRVFNEQR